MSLWIVLRHEYGTALRRRAFLLVTLGLPAFFVLVIGLAVLAALTSLDRRPVGYVDLAGVLSGQASSAGGRASVELLPMPDETAALAALQAGQVQAVFLLPIGYRQTGRVVVYTRDKAPSQVARAALDDALRAGLLAGRPAAARERLLRGLELTLRSADGSRELSQSTILNLVLPIAAGVLFSFATLSSASYLVQAVATEKENRTVEVMMTSVTSFDLIGGKALGLMVVALTQLAIWVIAAVAAAALAARFTGILHGVQLPWPFLLVLVLFFVPSYALITGMMTAVGSAVSEVHQAQQIAGTLNLLFVFPYFLFPLLVASPNGTLATALTLFPTTSFVALAMRWPWATVPAWQIVAGWAFLVATASASLWAASRIFRANMLAYGQGIDLHRLLHIPRRRT